MHTKKNIELTKVLRSHPSSNYGGSLYGLSMFGNDRHDTRESDHAVRSISREKSKNSILFGWVLDE